MIDNNSQQVNSFVDGMDLDTDDQYLSSRSYRAAYNLRLSSREGGNTGSLNSIEGVKYYQNITADLPLDESGNPYLNAKVVHADTIRRYGVLFVTATSVADKYYFVYRFIDKDELQPGESGSPKLIFGPCKTPLGEEISTVTKYEDDDNVKVYYADSINPLRVINISPLVDSKRPMTDDGAFSIYPTVVMSKPSFQGFGFGNLKVGAYQYGYQLFNKNGAETEVSPLTELIYTTPSSISPSSSREVHGGMKGENSGKSIQLNIPINDTKYDRIKIVSVFYEDTAAQPLIQVIKDTAIQAGGVMQFVAVDNEGITALTVEEFNMISSVHFVPKILESKNNYLFASDIQYEDNTFDVSYDARAYSYGFNSADEPIAVLKNANDNGHTIHKMADILGGVDIIPEDKDCINPYSIINQNASTFIEKAPSSSLNPDILKCAYCFDGSSQGYVYGGQGVNVGYKFVVTELQEASADARLFEGVWCTNVAKGGANVNLKFNKLLNTRKTLTCNYSNPIISSNLKSLRRDEVYRYSIIFYNKFNQASPAKWIADIRVPALYDLGFESFRAATYTSFLEDKSDLAYTQLAVRPVGIEFTVKNLPDSVVSYEIVRCKRDEGDRATITQGIIGCTNNPVQGQPSGSNVFTQTNRLFPSKYMIATSGYFSTEQQNQDEYYKNTDISYNASYDNGGMFGDWDGRKPILKTQVETVVNFTSPEICYNYERMRELLPSTGAESQLVKFIFPFRNNESDTPGLLDEFEGGKYRVLSYPGFSGFPPTSVTARDWHPFFYNSKESLQERLLWNQSNKCTAMKSLEYGSIGEVDTDAGNSVQISRLEFPKEASWKDYQQRADYTTGVGSYIYDNWMCDTLDQGQSIVGSQGPHGRSIVIHNGNPITYNSQIYGRSIVSKYKVKSTKFADKVMPNITYVNGDTLHHYGNSVIGTALCNIRKKTVPYGGYGYGDRQFSTYISIGAFKVASSNPQDANKQLISFSGDTYINDFIYINLHYFKGMEADGNVKTDQEQNVAYSIPTESSINLAYRDNVPFNRYSQIEPANINGKYVQDKPLYVYNSIYSVEPTARLFTPSTIYDEYNKHIDVRTHYSLSKNNDEFVDSWTKFKPLNYLDVDTRYGAITNLRTFGNELIYWQENAVGKFSVHERTLITDNSNTPLMLGTGGALSRYDYLATVNGLKAGHKDSDCQSDTVLYWYDYDKHELCQYSGGSVVCLSKYKRVQTYLNRLALTLPEQIGKPVLTFDKYYNEVIASLAKGESLIFSESAQQFTGFYTIVPDYNMYFNSGVYMVKDGKLFLYNADVRNTGFDGQALPVELNYIVNKDYLRTKVYDNIEFTGYLLSSQITFDFKADEVPSKKLTGHDITNREYNYRAAVPRALTGEKFGNRMRGRILHCKMKYNLVQTQGINIITNTNEEYMQTIQRSEYIITNNAGNVTDLDKRFELPYIRTTYRISRS